jgi:hypothetical protein
MHADSSKGARIAAWVMAGIVAAFIVFDGAIHLLKPQPVLDSFAELGYPLAVSIPLGLVELACLVLYLIPRTSVLGAVLFTGYFGGAIATNLRVGKPLFSTVLFPVYLGLLLWGSLYLRNARVRALMPITAETPPEA